MALTSIGTQKTPGDPIEVTFAGQTGLPSNASTVLMVGHAASGATGVNTVIAISNVGSSTLVTTEANAKFGAGSEMAKMVIAGVKAVEGGSTFPAILCVPLASTDVTIAAAAQAAIQRVPSNFIVSPYDFNTDATDRTLMIGMATTMSGAQRVQNQQYGCFAVGATQATTDPSTLFKFDTQFGWGIWNRNSAPAYTVGEVAAACANVAAANGVPFNPLDDITVTGVTASANQADWPSVGAGLESEVCLNQGWTPLWVKPNTEVAFVRTVTGRLTVNGAGQTPVTAYFDLQDFQVLYFWRKTLFTRFSQPDFKQAKASLQKGQAVKSEAIRLARQFEDQNMFQAVSLLAKQFVVQGNASDRSRFDVFTPVNVIPGLHVIATNVQATTSGDVVTV